MDSCNTCMNDKIDEDKYCNICMNDKIEEDNMTLLPCTHKMCNVCFDKWRSKSNLCPYCKIEFEPKKSDLELDYASQIISNKPIYIDLLDKLLNSTTSMGTHFIERTICLYTVNYHELILLKEIEKTRRETGISSPWYNFNIVKLYDHSIDMRDKSFFDDEDEQEFQDLIPIYNELRTKISNAVLKIDICKQNNDKISLNDAYIMKRDHFGLTPEEVKDFINNREIVERMKLLQSEQIGVYDDSNDKIIIEYSE